jgi:hypothetical protein
MVPPESREIRKLPNYFLFTDHSSRIGVFAAGTATSQNPVFVRSHGHISDRATYQELTYSFKRRLDSMDIAKVVHLLVH